MRSENRGDGRDGQPPVVLVKWYDTTRWLLERVDSFPKSQRFIFGQRVTEKLGQLRLRMHPDKYRVLPTAKGVDFAG